MSKTNTAQGSVHTCAHEVAYNYDLHYVQPTPELLDELADEAEERAHFCISSDGYVSGELNFLYRSRNGQERELRGWWEIVRE